MAAFCVYVLVPSLLGLFGEGFLVGDRGNDGVTRTEANEFKTRLSLLGYLIKLLQTSFGIKSMMFSDLDD